MTYAAMTKDAAQRSIRTFYEAVMIQGREGERRSRKPEDLPDYYDHQFSAGDKKRDSRPPAVRNIFASRKVKEL